MRKVYILFLFFSIMIAAIFFVLQGPMAHLTHPKGIIAHKELRLITINVCLMLSIVLPTFIFLLLAILRPKKKSSQSLPSLKMELLLWVLPSTIVAIMTIITWRATHELDPFQPIKSEVAPIKIEVMALDWKWLFIYPDLGIGALNFCAIPTNTPIEFHLSADGSPMNSFWVPQLAGQIYAMSGMITKLHIMADEVGEYGGKAAEINGKGYADMTFVIQSMTPSNFESWVGSVQAQSTPLDQATYSELVKPSQNDPVILYSRVEDKLFYQAVMKYMHHD